MASNELTDEGLASAGEHKLTSQTVDSHKSNPDLFPTGLLSSVEDSLPSTPESLATIATTPVLTKSIASKPQDIEVLFARFAELPAELERLVWSFAADESVSKGRLVSFDDRNRCQRPPMMLACKASRKAILKKYVKLFNSWCLDRHGRFRSPFNVYINYDADIVYLKGRLGKSPINRCFEVFEIWLRPTKHLALNLFRISLFEFDIQQNGSIHFWDTVMRSCLNLTKLTFYTEKETRGRNKPSRSLLARSESPQWVDICRTYDVEQRAGRLAGLSLDFKQYLDD